MLHDTTANRQPNANGNNTSQRACYVVRLLLFAVIRLLSVVDTSQTNMYIFFFFFRASRHDAYSRHAYYYVCNDLDIYYYFCTVAILDDQLHYCLFFIIVLL